MKPTTRSPALFLFILIILGLPVCAFGQAISFCGLPPLPEKPLPPAPQGNWTIDDWVTWRDQSIRRILEPTFPSNGELLLCRDQVISRCADAYSQLDPILKTNPNLIDPSSQLGKSLGNFIQFVTAQHWMAVVDAEGHATHALGMEITDQEYFDLARLFADFPELLKSDEFLEKMASPATYRDANAMIDKVNTSLAPESKWIVVPFRAQFIQSVDRTTYGRMIVFIPKQPAPGGGTVDKWVLFAIATPDMQQDIEIKSVSVFASYRSSPAATKTSTYALDYMRIKDSNTGKITPTAVIRLPYDPKHTSKNCYDCHKAAVMPLHPKVEYAFDNNGKLVEKSPGTPSQLDDLNDLIESYGPPDFVKQQAGAYGPSLGPLNRNRTDDFIKTASGNADLPPESIVRIRRAMNCSRCHDRFAPINYIQGVRSSRDVQAFEGGRGIVESMIEKGLMPPDTSLSDDERKALWRCLMKEYLDLNTTAGVFVEWLRGNSQQQSPEPIYLRLAAWAPVSNSSSEDDLRAIVHLREQLFGAQDDRTQIAKRYLAAALIQKNHLDEAEKLLTPATAHKPMGYGDSHEARLESETQLFLADVLRRQGQQQKADELTRSALKKDAHWQPQESDLPIHGF